jgi:2-methylisocitrate lyase-like PEP mutase family enzyme
MVKGGKTPLLSAAELEAGYKLAVFASDVQRAAIYGMREVLKIMKRDGTPDISPRPSTSPSAMSSSAWSR